MAICDFSGLAICYAELNGRVRPRADLQVAAALFLTSDGSGMRRFKKRESTEGAGANMLTSQLRSNPLQANLSRVGFPWQFTRQELAAKFGIRKHAAYGWDVIEIASDRPLVDNLLWPLSAQVFPQFSPNMPAAHFSGVSYVSDDARENLRAVVSQLQPILGPGKSTSVSNCVGHRWYFDDGSVELHAWPPELQRGRINNPAHEREPRLKTGCHVQIDTGFRLPASVQERGWVESFVPIARLPELPISSGDSHFAGTPQHELEFIRRAEPNFKNMQGSIGCSADRSALIFQAPELYIVPIADVRQFRLARVLPAKGGGGSWLQVECSCEYDRQLTKSLTICAGRGVDDLTDLGTMIAAGVGKRLEVLPYEYDC